MIHVVTPVARPQFLPLVHQSLVSSMPYPWRWWTIFDLKYCAPVLCFPTQIALIINHLNPGGFAARNVALDLIGSGWIVFLDDDSLVHPDFPAAFTKARADHPEAGAFLFKAIDWTQPTDHADRPDRGHWQIGEALVLKRESIGEERLAVEGGSPDFAFFNLMQKKLGDRLVWRDETCIWHNRLCNDPDWKALPQPQ